jgi:hypothetical protein
MHARRTILKGAGAFAVALGLGLEVKAMEEVTLYGLIGQMLAQPGQRDALLAILAEGMKTRSGSPRFGRARKATPPRFSFPPCRTRLRGAVR